jgi:serine/threonine protein kinase
MTERDIFLAVLDLSDRAARAAYLDSACGGNADLRSRVESLLQSHDTAGNFLDSPAVAPQDLNTAATQDQASETKPDEALTFLAPPGRPDSLGRIGHYEVLEVLGQGGFGIVLRAFDEVLQRVVALKVLAPQMAATSPALKRFLREARSSARVRHENVVQVHAVEEQPLPYLVMEFIPGETLQQRLDRTGPLETLEIVRIGRQIAEGLAAAHDTGLIHRDIKPGNILIEAGPHLHVKITDFGLARAADDASLTQSGLVAGTPMFMSPEQANGESLDYRADLFSFGSVLYTMTTGRSPFRAPNTLAVLKRVAEDTPRPIPEIIPEAPAWLCDLIARLHARKPEDRFASAREVADLLETWQAELQQHGVVRSPLNPTPAASRPSRKRGWIIAAGLLLALVGLGVAEATGVTKMQSTVIQLFSPEGTLVVEVDDPGVSVVLDGDDLLIKGAGLKEVRLKPGRYTALVSKDGKVLREELITISQNGRRLLRVSREPQEAATRKKSVATLPVEEQVKAVVNRLKKLNSDFGGKIRPGIEQGRVTKLEFFGRGLQDLSAVRVLPGLRSLVSRERNDRLANLSPLEGMRLTELVIPYSAVSDLKPLRGMPLARLDCANAAIEDLTPLKGMNQLVELSIQHSRVKDLTALAKLPLVMLNCSHTAVTDLAPLKGMKLKHLYCDGTKAVDLSALKGLPLESLNCRGYDLSAQVNRGVLRSLNKLTVINSVQADQFWKELDGKSSP